MNSKERAELVAERKYKETTDKLPPRTRLAVRWGYIHFDAPKFWNDDRICSRLTAIFRTTTNVMIAIALILTAATLLMNDKKREWNLNIFNNQGEVKTVTHSHKISE